MGELVRVSDEFVLLPDQIDGIISTIRSLADPFSLSDFKDATGLSRKYAMPILEWADRAGVTQRLGDLRRHVGPAQRSSVWGQRSF
jgi:selenocysteine-specific elongation factor